MKRISATPTYPVSCFAQQPFLLLVPFWLYLLLVLKQALAILLLFAFLLPFAGRYTSIKYQAYHTKKKIKRQMIAGLDCADLVLLKFSKTDTRTKLNWKHSKEFEYGGEWYDIVYTDTVGTDSLHYWLFWDHEETKLNRQLASLVANALGNDPATKDKNTRFNHFAKDIYCIELPILQTPPLHGSEVRYSLAGAPLTRPTLPLAPPPEAVKA